MLLLNVVVIYFKDFINIPSIYPSKPLYDLISKSAIFYFHIY